VAGFLLTVELLAMSSPRIIFAVLIALDLTLLLLMLRRATRAKASALLRGVVTGSALAMLLSATCWGIALTSHL
jgi:hypothetical protein